MQALKNIPPLYLMGAVAIGALLLYVGRVGAKGAGYTASAAAFDFADGVISAPVLKAGDVLGIPRTDETKCEAAKREGRTLDASFDCPAGNFLKYLFS